ncbi:hypothetical protein M8994_22920, partial [Brucella sp. 21LCYQ03]|nr:hypothetical protein [Brucella sp. 21LCYQ03]
MPEIPGFSECWGVSVIHCPYCHGYEFRRKRTGILVPEDPTAAIHLSGLVKNLTSYVTLFTNGNTPFDATQLMNFEELNIKVNTQKISKIQHQD